MVRTTSSGSQMSASRVTRAEPVAKLTAASDTLSSRDTFFWMRAAHEAVMP